MTAKGYYLYLLKIIGECPLILSSNLEFKEIDTLEGYIKGRLELSTGLQLYLVEYVIIEKNPILLKYKYHLQDMNDSQIMRGDNAPHHRELSSFPHHKHDSTNRPIPSIEMNLEKVFVEISALLSETGSSKQEL